MEFRFAKRDNYGPPVSVRSLVYYLYGRAWLDLIRPFR
jgi:hypothetical protein